MPKTVSVIVPVYNVEPYLPRCIESLLAQTYTALEILLINDGSTDHSGTICDEYAAKDSRLKVIHKENGGVSSARNLGLKNAAGDYIGFLDSDDYVAPTIFETLVKQLEATAAHISVCGFANEETPGNFTPYFKGEKKTYCFDNSEQIANLLQNQYYSCSCCDKLFCREVLNGITFDKTITHYEDLLFLYEAMKRSSKLVFSPEPLYYYCTNEGSASTGRFSDKMMTMIDVYDRIYAEKRGDPALASVVRQEYVRNNVMCAINAANSGYKNKAAIRRMRSNVRKEWGYYVTHNASLGYKLCATLLILNWTLFKKYVKRYARVE